MANLTMMLDIVKVMAFALQEGKIAIHCHAGLGRTGIYSRNALGSVKDRYSSEIQGFPLSSLQVC